MTLKHLLGSFLILIIAASAMSPALGAVGIKNHSDNAKFIAFEISDDEWNNLTDEEKEARLGHFKVVGDAEGNVRFSLRTMPAHDADDDTFKAVFSFKAFDSEEMKLLESMNEEEKEAYFLAKFKENLDIEVEAGNLTQEEADQMYDDRKSGKFAAVSLVACDISLTALSEEEFETLKDMTDEEKDAFLLEHFKRSLDEAVAEGTITQEEADEMLAARESGVHAGQTGFAHGRAVRFAMTSETLSEEEIETLQNMTADDKKDFFLSQIKASLDADVAAGNLTQEEADEIYAYHESGSLGYTRGNMIHKTAAFRTEAVPATE